MNKLNSKLGTPTIMIIIIIKDIYVKMSMLK